VLYEKELHDAFKMFITSHILGTKKMAYGSNVISQKLFKQFRAVLFFSVWVNNKKQKILTTNAYSADTACTVHKLTLLTDLMSLEQARMWRR